jgi:methyltransferase-like protein
MELDGSAASEYKDAILTVLSESIHRHIRIQSVVGDEFSSQLRAIDGTS